MADIRYRGQSYSLLGNESVLEALLRHGFAVTHSCRAGVCGSCLMRSTAGSLPSRSQAGMKDSWKSRGYFYSCSCVPESAIEVSDPAEDFRVGAAITSLQLLSADVLRAGLKTDKPMDFRAGQYITIVRGDLARSYSIASLPEESELELHIRKVPDGRMSGWFHDQARVGERLSIVGPSGECFYVPGREDQPLLLAGTGTGLAPLYGIVRDALKNGHRGPIQLFHGAVHTGGLYLVDELRALARQNAQLEYTAAILKEPSGPSGEYRDRFTVGPMDSVILSRIPKLAGWRGFVCGDPGLVQALKKKLFLSGMASRDIYADAFIPAARS